MVNKFVSDQKSSLAGDDPVGARDSGRGLAEVLATIPVSFLIKKKKKKKKKKAPTVSAEC